MSLELWLTESAIMGFCDVTAPSPSLGLLGEERKQARVSL